MNINTAKIKYVIAREGLIVISLLICMAVSLYIDSWKTDKIDNYVKAAKEITISRKQYAGLPEGYELLPPTDKDHLPRPSLDEIYDQSIKGAKYTSVDYDPFMEPKVQFPKSTPYDVIKRTMDRNYPAPGAWTAWDKAQNINIKARYDDKGNPLFTGFPWDIDFKNQIALFLLFAYPAYLLIRFIVWASLTVRNKN